MTRREQFVLFFIAGAVLVGAAVLAATRPDDASTDVPADSNTPRLPVVERAPTQGPSEAAVPESADEEQDPLPDAAISVLGAVRSPGVYRLPMGSRVNDLIERAGGANADADLSDINLAATLIDGTTLTIPAKPSVSESARPRIQRSPPSPARFNPPQYSISRWQGGNGSTQPGGGGGQALGGNGSGGLLNINTASQEQLETLPGVGPVKASAIIRYRRENRFTTETDLMNVSGIGPKTFENIRPFVKVR